MITRWITRLSPACRRSSHRPQNSERVVTGKILSSRALTSSMSSAHRSEETRALQQMHPLRQIGHPNFPGATYEKRIGER